MAISTAYDCMETSMNYLKKHPFLLARYPQIVTEMVIIGAVVWKNHKISWNEF